MSALNNEITIKNTIEWLIYDHNIVSYMNFLSIIEICNKKLNECEGNVCVWGIGISFHWFSVRFGANFVNITGNNKSIFDLIEFQY